MSFLWKVKEMVVAGVRHQLYQGGARLHSNYLLNENFCEKVNRRILLKT